MDSSIFRLNADFEERHWWFTARRRIFRDLLTTIVPPSDDSLVVDVGCGTGGNTAFFADMYRCIGIDPSPEGIAFAKERFTAGEFIHGFAPDDLGEAAAEADVFLINDVLEHVEDDFQLLSSLTARAKKGAYFLITVPADMRLWSRHDISHHHFRRYDLGRFKRTWEQLPLSELLISHFNSRLYPLIRAIRAAARLTGTTAGQSESDLTLPNPAVNAMLEGVFSGEAARLRKVLDGDKKRAYSHGVSLIAILRREEGPASITSKPSDLAADPHNPFSAGR